MERKDRANHHGDPSRPRPAQHHHGIHDKLAEILSRDPDYTSVLSNVFDGMLSNIERAGK